MTVEVSFIVGVDNKCLTLIGVERCVFYVVLVLNHNLFKET